VAENRLRHRAGAAQQTDAALTNRTAQLQHVTPAVLAAHRKVTFLITERANVCCSPRIAPAALVEHQYSCVLFYEPVLHRDRGAGGRPYFRASLRTCHFRAGGYTTHAVVPPMLFLSSQLQGDPTHEFCATCPQPVRAVRIDKFHGTTLNGHVARLCRELSRSRCCPRASATVQFHQDRAARAGQNRARRINAECLFVLSCQPSLPSTPRCHRRDGKPGGRPRLGRCLLGPSNATRRNGFVWTVSSPSGCSFHIAPQFRNPPPNASLPSANAKRRGGLHGPTLPSPLSTPLPSHRTSATPSLVAGDASGFRKEPGSRCPAPTLWRLHGFAATFRSSCVRSRHPARSAPPSIDGGWISTPI